MMFKFHPAHLSYPTNKSRLEIFGYKFYVPYPIAFWLGSSSAVVFGISVFGKSSNKFIDISHSFFKKIRDMKYWFLYRYSKEHQYHLIDTKLKPSYYDIDHVMLHGVMALVCRYIEEEYKGEDDFEKYVKDISENHDPNMDEEYYKNFNDINGRILQLYRWWKYERPTNLSDLDILNDKLYDLRRIKKTKVENSDFFQIDIEVSDNNKVDYDNLKKMIDELNTKIENDEQKYLHEAVDLRRSMWT